MNWRKWHWKTFGSVSTWRQLSWNYLKLFKTHQTTRELFIVLNNFPWNQNLLNLPKIYPNICIPGGFCLRKSPSIRMISKPKDSWDKLRHIMHLLIFFEWILFYNAFINKSYIIKDYEKNIYVIKSKILKILL